MARIISMVAKQSNWLIRSFKVISKLSIFGIIIIVSSVGCKKDYTKLVEKPPVYSYDYKPNIIVILGDDVGYEIPNYTGGESYSTPNIDQLASQGMRFSRCHSAPLCSPSRFMLLTGKYNQRNYYTDSWGDLDRSQLTIANMLKSAGYATCAVGKWQLNGGDTSLHDFGFDSYRVTNPFKLSGSEDGESGISLYKNPLIYQDADYLPEDSTRNRYGEDMMVDYMSRFIDNNKDKPFFIYWAPNLCHAPFCPTPDDPEFATWDPAKPRELADTMFYPSMVKYYDKEVGRLMEQLRTTGLDKKTIVIHILGDNGTESDINSLYKGEIIPGGKGKAIENGIHVPLIVSWPGHITPSENRNLVDFVDFLPTIAGLATIPKPTNFGILDGISFHQQVLGFNYSPRQAGYCYYDVNRKGDDGKIATIWALDTMYKLYDHKRGFYNTVSDPYENTKLRNENSNAADDAARSRLQDLIDSYK